MVTFAITQINKKNSNVAGQVRTITFAIITIHKKIKRVTITVNAQTITFAS